MSSHRMTVRNASTAPRQRQTMARRLTRHSCFTHKRDVAFQVRRSLVEYVDDELENMNTSVFYQRIFVFAKNCPMAQERLSVISKDTTGTRGSTGTWGLDVPLPEDESATLGTNTGVTVEATSVPPATVEAGETMPEETQSKVTGDTTTATATATVTATVTNTNPTEPPLDMAEEKETVTQTFRFTEEPDFTTNEEIVPEQEPEPVIKPKKVDGPKDAFALFKDKLEELHVNCLKKMITPDPMCGLFLYMGDYTMLMLESGEDMMGLFCNDLLECCDEFWLNNQVFQVEDHIHELYTKELIFRRIPAAHLNEKFPTSTPTDEYLMGKQHLIIKDKLVTILRMIQESLEPHGENEAEIEYENENEEYMDSEGEEEQTETQTNANALKRVASHISDTLTVENFRPLLPEIQRIDLVLASTRFYYTLSEFQALYGRTPFTRDDEGLYWPIPNNYTPPNIFRRTPFDINLTFGEYAAKMRSNNEADEQEHGRPQSSEMQSVTEGGTEGENRSVSLGEVKSQASKVAEPPEPEPQEE